MQRLTLFSATLVSTMAAAGAPYQYTIPVPPGIAAPKEVPTRFGTLKFFDGVPDPAGTQKIYDNLDFQRAMQAYLLGLPAVNQLEPWFKKNWRPDDIRRVQGPAHGRVRTILAAGRAGYPITSTHPHDGVPKR